MGDYTVVFEATLEVADDDLDMLTEVIMDALLDSGAEDPFVFADNSTRVVRIEVVIHAQDRARGLAAGAAAIGSALDSITLGPVGDASAHAEELVPA